jgi:hypothetical protein
LSYQPRAATALQLGFDVFTQQPHLGALAIFISAKRLTEWLQQVGFLWQQHYDSQHNIIQKNDTQHWP